MRKRRYEILLPLKHNDGRPVGGEVLEQTREELVAQFGAITVVPQAVFGIWQHEGQRFEDELVRWVIDVEDTPENHQFLASYKSVMLERFEQIDIYIASYPVDIL
jgi:hypothetical protein